ncbi:MAG: hypothetical protein H8E26_01635 [FCB group bacterium]|nr:hypothetical protein [FCB group bacterium]MBL7123233.1 hypothetical protein [Candidatus Neomarinimicrobiota bacterium]
MTIEVDPSAHSVTYSDSILIGSPNASEHFPTQGRFPLRLRLHKSQDGGDILTEGLYLKIASPKFYIRRPDSVVNFELRLKDTPLKNVTLVIEDDKKYPVFGATGEGDIGTLQLVWGNSFEWSGHALSNEFTIDDTTNPSLWRLDINSDTDSVFEISGIDLTPLTTMTDRSNHPFIRVGDSRIDLWDTFIVGAPSIQARDTILNGSYDHLMSFPGFEYIEDDSVGISEYLPSQSVELNIISATDIVWAKTENQRIVTDLASLNPGDTLELLKNFKIDHRRAIESSPSQLSFEVRLPDLDQGVIDTIFCSIEYPDVPAQPFFAGDSMMLPLYSGETVTHAFLINIDNSDTFKVDLASHADIHEQFTTKIPGSQDIPTITFPRVALIKIDAQGFHWISDQMSRGDRVTVQGLIGSPVTRGERPFTIPVNIYPFQFFRNTQQKHVFNQWPSGKMLETHSLDSLRWRLYTARDSLKELTNGISDSLRFPSFLGEAGEIYYLEYSPWNTSGLGLRYTLPILLDSLPPMTTSRWPLPGDTSEDPGIQPHPISIEEVIYTQYFENLLASSEHSNELLYWDSPEDHNADTLILIEGFIHTSWPTYSVQRKYVFDSNQDSTIISDVVSLEELELSLGETLERLKRGNLASVDSIINLVGADDPEARNVLLVTTSIDMAGNMHSDTLLYPLIHASDGPIYEHFFNYPNPLDPRSGQSTHFSFLVKEESSEVSMIILDAGGSMVRRFAQQDLSAGRHEIEWDGRNMWDEICATGIYFTILDVADQPQVYTKTLVVNR